MEHNPDIGRELKADELEAATIVVIKSPDRDFYVTMWVAAIDHDSVTFFSAIANWHVINARQPDGTIVDDQNREVHVFEYLGEP